MTHSFSSNMKVILRNNKASKIIYYTKVDLKVTPIKQVKEDEKILKGFIWKPKERPVSKESIIPSYNKKPALMKKAPNGKPVVKNPGNEKAGKDTSAINMPGKPGNVKTTKDTTVINAPKKPDNIKADKDSTVKSPTQKMPAVTKPAKDSTAVKSSVVAPAKAKKDSLKKE